MPRKASNWAEIRNPHDERGESPMQGEGECNGRFGVSQREQAAQVVSWCQRNCNQKAWGFPKKKLQKGPGRERGNNCTIAIQRSDVTRQLCQLPTTCPSPVILPPGLYSRGVWERSWLTRVSPGQRDVKLQAKVEEGSNIVWMQIWSFYIQIDETLKLFLKGIIKGTEPA